MRPRAAGYTKGVSFRKPPAMRLALTPAVLLVAVLLAPGLATAKAPAASSERAHATVHFRIVIPEVLRLGGAQQRQPARGPARFVSVVERKGVRVETVSSP